MSLESGAIVSAFEEGRGVEFPVDQPEELHQRLGVIHRYLSTLATERSFSWPSFNGTVPSPTRKSVWVATRPDGEPVTSHSELKNTDGDIAAGSRGIEALQNAEVRNAFTTLHRYGATCLRASALAVGIPPEVIQEQCTVRTRLIAYDGSPESGIGPHFDGNTLTAVISDGPGLTEIARDGEVYPVNHNAISVMAGTALYRASRGRERPFIPALHTVRSAEKTTMALFFNMPDKTDIPSEWLGTGFYHDVGVMKAQDGPGPKSPLNDLWEAVASGHGIDVDNLAKGKIPRLDNNDATS